MIASVERQFDFFLFIFLNKPNSSGYEVRLERSLGMNRGSKLLGACGSGGQGVKAGLLFVSLRLGRVLCGVCNSGQLCLILVCSGITLGESARCINCLNAFIFVVDFFSFQCNWLVN